MNDKPALRGISVDVPVQRYQEERTGQVYNLGAVILLRRGIPAAALPARGERGHGESRLQRGRRCAGLVDAESGSGAVSVQGDDVGVAQGKPGLGEPDVPHGPGHENGCNVAAALPPGGEQPAVLTGKDEPVLGKSHALPGHADQSQHVLHSGEGRTGKIFDPGGNFKHLSETYI